MAFLYSSFGCAMPLFLGETSRSLFFPPDVKQTFTSAVKKTLKRLRQGERIKRCSRAFGRVTPTTRVHVQRCDARHTRARVSAELQRLQAASNGHRGCVVRVQKTEKFRKREGGD